METKFDIAMMVKVAQMYYINGMKQDEIAREVQISRALVSMILTEAKEVGIVEINIRNPLLNEDFLSSEFKTLFGLKKCLIIPTAVQDPNTLRKLVAQRAIDLFNEEVRSQYTVGIAWGRTCYEFVSYYRANNVASDVSIIPLIGGSNQNAPYFQLNEMVRLFAEKMNAVPYFMHAPALTSSVEEKEMFVKSASMQPIIEKWSGVDIVVSGIGTLPNSSNIDRETYIGEFEIYRQLEKKEAVGDICARYFNINGEFIKDDFSYDRVISIPVENLKSAGKVICAASGKEKVHSILGALRTGVMSAFIADEQTAKAVLKLHKTLG